MDATPLEDYFSVLEAKIMSLGNYSYELRSILSLIRSRHVEINPEQLKAIEKMILAAVKTGNELDAKLQKLVTELQKIVFPEITSE